MPEIDEKDWTKYQIGGNVRTLESVYHVTHKPIAVEIVRGRKIRPDLVYDDSILKQERTLVVWLSPNDWKNAGGSRYGTVSFAVNWRKLIEGKNIYWVGAMADYTPVACRFLITDQVRNDLPPYDPTKNDGPWYHNKATDEHIWNGEYCLEFMVEQPIWLGEIEQIGTVDHHPLRCCISPGGGCLEAGVEELVTPRFFIAELLGRRLHIPNHLVTKDGKLNVMAERAWTSFYRWLGNDGYGMGDVPNDAIIDLIRSVLVCFGRKDWDAANRLRNMLKNRDVARSAAAEVFGSALEIDPATLLTDE